MPGNKNAYRLYSSDGHALIDLLQKETENAPKNLQKVLCRHPFQESKRAYVIPTRVEPLFKVTVKFNCYLVHWKLCQFIRSIGKRGV